VFALPYSAADATVAKYISQMAIAKPHRGIIHLMPNFDEPFSKAAKSFQQTDSKPIVLCACVCV